MSHFQNQLRRIRLLLQGGRVAAALILTAAIAALLWLAFGLLDLRVAFEPTHRTTITWALAAITAITLATLLIRALRISRTTAATLADHRLADPRGTVSSALSLQARPAETPMAQWLASRTLDAAATRLSHMKSRQIIPWHLLKKSAIPLVATLAILGTLRLSSPHIFSTIASRLLHPSADIPPYSPLVFKLDPANPQTTYGGEILLTATITGASIDHPVECLVQTPGKSQTLRLPAFRETPTRYSRKLDGLTEPVRIAFACGKARSRWIDVEILLEPRILAGIVHITPPPHTNLQTSSFPLDTNEIAAVEGSSVTLELTSNRPLASGSLLFSGADGSDSTPESHTATIPSPYTASFSWTATRAGRVSATVNDLRGTPSAQPLDLAVRVVPDQTPTVALSSPPRFILATPKSVIPVTGTATDDFGLSKLQFVRTLAGFRDRIRVVAPALREKSHSFQENLNLYDLGLEAGQVIELMLEASDHNPSLLGHGSSEISRIKIISEDEYAQYIRSKTTTEQFAARFDAARQAIDEARKALEQLRDAESEEDAEKALENAKDAHKKAAELMDRIAGDFPAFELEKRLQDLAEKQADTLRQNLDDLNQPNPDPEKLLKRLGQQQQQRQEIEQDAKLARDAAKILEMAAKFREIYENQVSVTKRFATIVEELRKGENQNRRLLPALAETQLKNRQALDEFKVEMRRRIDALADADPALLPLIDSALLFLDELDAAQPETLMDAAADHSKAGQANDAYTNAELARALLERLLSEPEPFPEAVMGKPPELDVPRQDVNENIRQMLEAMLGRIPGQDQGQGQGQGDAPGGQGQGPGGFGPAGAPGSGFSMDLPVIGPDRLQFDPLAGPSAGGNGEGRTGPVPPLPETAESGTITPPPTRSGDASSHSPESIPEPYRDAVKRYFTP
jgi:hypothetical protein